MRCMSWHSSISNMCWIWKGNVKEGWDRRHDEGRKYEGKNGGQVEKGPGGLVQQYEGAAQHYVL